MAAMPILLLHGCDTAQARLRDAADAALRRWPGAPPPLRSEPAWAVLDQAKLLKGAGVAWLWIDNDDDGRLFELIDQLQGHHLPVMLSGRDVSAAPATTLHDGVIACPPDTDAQTAATMLAALHSQAGGFAAMRAEVELMRLHGAGMVDQMSKVDEELRLAAQLQREFLPRTLPRVGGLAFGVMWRPASYVSGDIYDVQRLDEEHVGMFIADAVGHGVPAALMTVYIKRSLVTKQIDPDHPNHYRIVDPGEALARLNAEMVNQRTDKVRFATAAYAVINTRTLHARVARAGHPFPMLLRAGGDTQMLKPDGGILGVFEEQAFEQCDVQLQPDDRLLLYSDGFEMAFPERGGQQAGRVANNRYEREFENLRTGPFDAKLAELGSLIDTQAGSLNQRDDLTVVGAVVEGEERKVKSAK